MTLSWRLRCRGRNPAPLRPRRRTPWCPRATKEAARRRRPPRRTCRRARRPRRPRRPRQRQRRGRARWRRRRGRSARRADPRRPRSRKTKTRLRERRALPHMDASASTGHVAFPPPAPGFSAAHRLLFHASWPFSGARLAPPASCSSYAAALAAFCFLILRLVPCPFPEQPAHSCTVAGLWRERERERRGAKLFSRCGGCGGFAVCAVVQREDGGGD